MINNFIQSKKKELQKAKEEINQILYAIEKIENKYENINSILDINDGIIFFALLKTYNTPQKKSPIAQSFIIKKLGGREVSPSENCGDFILDNKKIELKVSFTNAAETLNIRQIRPWQDVDFYYCFYIDENNINNSNFYILSKEEMNFEIELCGSATHGTKTANENNQNIEYSITIPQKNETRSKKTHRWEQYKNLLIKEQILYG